MRARARFSPLARGEKDWRSSRARPCAQTKRKERTQAEDGSKRQGGSGPRSSQSGALSHRSCTSTGAARRLIRPGGEARHRKSHQARHKREAISLSSRTPQRFHCAHACTYVCVCMHGRIHTWYVVAQRKEQGVEQGRECVDGKQRRRDPSAPEQILAGRGEQTRTLAPPRAPPRDLGILPAQHGRSVNQESNADSRESNPDSIPHTRHAFANREQQGRQGAQELSWHKRRLVASRHGLIACHSARPTHSPPHNKLNTAFALLGTWPHLSPATTRGARG